MADGSHDAETGELTPREPSLEDLVELCRQLHNRNARFLVAGGFAIRAAGYPRHTADIDLLIEAGPENEAKVFDALAFLPDGCVKELRPGEVGQYQVVRVVDEIIVDLMARASGIDYAEASQSVTVHTIAGVAIPFASPELLWRMKIRANREKDHGDLQFLREYFSARGVTPPRG